VVPLDQVCSADLDIPELPEEEPELELPEPTACVARGQLPGTSDQWELESINLMGTRYTVEETTSLWEMQSFASSIFPFYGLDGQIDFFLDSNSDGDVIILYGEFF
jgi:hypothetical protein